MNTATLFLLIIAWAIAVLYTIGAAVTLWNGIKYQSNRSLQTLDELRGVRRTFPFIRRAAIAFLAWAFIVAYYLTH